MQRLTRRHALLALAASMLGPAGVARAEKGSGNSNGNGGGNGNGNAGGNGNGKGGGNGNGNGGGNGNGHGGGNGNGNGGEGGNAHSNAPSGNAGVPGPGDAPGAATDQDRAREAVAAGRALPLSQLLPRVESAYRGVVIDANLREARGRLTYDLKLLGTDGHVFVVSVDAATGRRRGTFGF